MVPFDGFAYFAVLLFVLPVAVALRLLAPTARAAILAATIVMVAIQYGGTGPMAGGALVGMSATVAAYALYQSLLVSVLAWLARRRRPIARGHRAGRPPRAASYAAITLAILPLVVVKFRPALDAAIGFLGLSYVTFRSLDVLFSIHDGTLDEVSPAEFLAFLFCFPTISAGPIDRYRRFAVDWRRPRDRAALVSDLDAGVHKVFTGFFYKFILAALISERWMRPALHHHGAGAILSYMYAYSFYLFFDFAGYSAFAIGVSYVLGVRRAGELPPPVSRAQHPRVLGPVAHQPVVVVQGSRLHAIPAAGDEAALVHEPLSRVVHRPGALVRADGRLARTATALHPLWAVPRVAAHRARCLQAHRPAGGRPRAILAIRCLGHGTYLSRRVFRVPAVLGAADLVTAVTSLLGSRSEAGGCGDAETGRDWPPDHRGVEDEPQGHLVPDCASGARDLVASGPGHATAHSGHDRGAPAQQPLHVDQIARRPPRHYRTTAREPSASHTT
jgi:hypothetical protein